MLYALACTNIASIRIENKYTSILDDEVFYGMKVEILESLKEWYRVKTHYHYEGFIHKSELVIDEKIISDFESKEKLMVINAYADVLSVPSVRGAILISLTRGAQLAKISVADQNGWIKVQLIDGNTGFIKEKFVATCIDSLIVDKYRSYYNNLDPKERIQLFLSKYLYISENKFRENIVKTSLTYLGTPYRLGGKSPLGIDCSGLCSMAYMLNGLIIYRNSSIKEDFPIYEIDIKNIKKSDLIFFDGHVVMYIGNDNYIHSTGKNGSDGVVINSLNPEHSNYREDLACSIKKVGSVFY